MRLTSKGYRRLSLRIMEGVKCMVAPLALSVEAAGIILTSATSVASFFHALLPGYAGFWRRVAGNEAVDVFLMHGFKFCPPVSATMTERLLIRLHRESLRGA